MAIVSLIISIFALIVAGLGLVLRYLDLKPEGRLQVLLLKEWFLYTFGSGGYKRFVDYKRKQNKSGRRRHQYNSKDL